MTPVNAEAEALEKALRRALDVLAAERNTGIGEHGFTDLKRAENSLKFACRDVAKAVDALPPPSQPRGWALTPGDVAAPPAVTEPYPTRTFRATPTSVQGPGMTEPVLYLPEGEHRCGWSEGCVNGPAVHQWDATCQERGEVTR